MVIFLPIIIYVYVAIYLHVCVYLSISTYIRIYICISITISTLISVLFSSLSGAHHGGCCEVLPFLGVDWKAMWRKNTKNPGKDEHLEASSVFPADCDYLHDNCPLRLSWGCPCEAKRTGREVLRGQVGEAMGSQVQLSCPRKWVQKSSDEYTLDTPFSGAQMERLVSKYNFKVSEN